MSLSFYGNLHIIDISPEYLLNWAGDLARQTRDGQKYYNAGDHG